MIVCKEFVNFYPRFKLYKFRRRKNALQCEINEIVNSINEVSSNTKVIFGEDAIDGNIMNSFFGAQGGIPFSPSVGITYQTDTNYYNSIDIGFTTANIDFKEESSAFAKEQLCQQTTGAMYSRANV